MKTYKPKIGDKVKIMVVSGSWEQHLVGKTGRLTGIFSDLPFPYLIHDLNNNWDCYASEVEPYIERRGRPRGSSLPKAKKTTDKQLESIKQFSKYAQSNSDCPKGGICDFRFLKEDYIRAADGADYLCMFFYCTKCLEIREKKI